MRFDPENYEPVEARITLFWQQHPEGRILTKLLTDPHSLDEIVVQAEVYFNADDPRPVATGLAFERRGGQGANQTSHLENGETSAIGRALANCDYRSKREPRPSREEMRKVSQGPAQTQQRPPARAPESSGDRAAAQKVQATEQHGSYGAATGAAEDEAQVKALRGTLADLYKRSSHYDDALPQEAKNPAFWSFLSTAIAREVHTWAEVTGEDMALVIGWLQQEVKS